MWTKGELGNGGGRPFTARILHGSYKAIEDLAQENRLTFAAAVSRLLLKALATENGGNEYAAKETGTADESTV